MDIQTLKDFLHKAAIATYAGGGQRIASEKPGFFDLEYREGEFYYRDSFAGYLASHGQEIVWYQDKPVWMCSYAGGMRGSKEDDADAAHHTFEFLKQAMRAGKKNQGFQPRGPVSFKEGDYEYINYYSGDVANFKGHEEILYKDELVFVHDYFGGIIQDGRK